MEEARRQLTLAVLVEGITILVHQLQQGMEVETTILLQVLIQAHQFTLRHQALPYHHHHYLTIQTLHLSPAREYNIHVQRDITEQDERYVYIDFLYQVLEESPTSDMGIVRVLGNSWECIRRD